MNSRLTLLGGLLIAQLVLIFAFNLIGGSEPQDRVFLDAEVASISRIEIADGEGAAVVLEQSEAGWQFEDGVPVDVDKVQDVLQRLVGADVPWPVATTASARERFEVTEDNFQRRVVLTLADDDTITLYLGSSPGYRRLHARNADSDDIFSIEFANFEIPAQAGEWLDRTLLQRETITGIEVSDGWRLTSSETAWQLDGEAADQAAVVSLVQRLSDIRVLDFFTGDEATLGPPRSIEVTDSEGAYTLTFRHDEENDEYVVTSDRVQGSFAVASFVVEQILVSAEELEPAVSEGEQDGEHAAIDADGEAAAEADPAVPVVEADP